jgi:FkbM family methyltransferase
MLRTLVDFVIKKFLMVDSFNWVILRNLELQKVRKYYGKDFLSPVQQFALDGYNSLLYKNLDIDRTGVVLVLGGYLGDSASNYSKTLSCKVHVYEPVADYFNILESRFQHNMDIHVHNEAISSSEKTILLSVNGEETGMYQHGEKRLKVFAKDIFQVVDHLGHVDLLEINVEGAEYEILERLISSNKIVDIDILQIQFHNFSNLHDLERARIRASLSETHQKIFGYDWVWERWALKRSSKVLDSM